MINLLMISKLAVLLVFGIACNDEDTVTPEKDLTTKETLKEKASFGIGAAIKVGFLEEAEYASTLIEHFDQISAEFEMKMEVIWSSSISYNWTKADELVDFATDNDMKVHGHTLLWYRSFPEWFKNANYDSLTFENKVKDYITDVVSRYKGSVISWDVANEIFTDFGTLREETVFTTFRNRSTTMNTFYHFKCLNIFLFLSWCFRFSIK